MKKQNILALAVKPAMQTAILRFTVKKQIPINNSHSRMSPGVDLC